MTTTALRAYPKLLQHKRWARNGFVPEAPFAGHVVRSQNHVMAYRRKCFAAASALGNGYASASGEVVIYRFRCHVGYGATHMAFRLGIGGDNSGRGTSSDPMVRCRLEIPGGAVTESFVHAGAWSSGTPTDAPDEIMWATNKMAVTANSTYEVQISVKDYCRLLAFTAYEIASEVCSSAVPYYADVASGLHYPIWDSTRQTFLQGLSQIWKRNGAHLLTWPGSGTSVGSSSQSTTWTNVIDGSTAYSTTSAGFYLGDGTATLEGLARYSAAYEVPCVLAAHCSVTNSATGEVRLLTDGGSVVASITGMGTTAAWYTGNVTVGDLDTLAKCDLQFRTSNASNTMTLNAVCLYTYTA